MTNDVNAFLASTGVTAAKFTTIGNTVKGVVQSADVRDQTDLKTGEVKRFSDGNAMKQVVITLQTTEHADDDDDGLRRVYAKGQMLAALRAAVGKDGLEEGGMLAVRYVGDGEATQRGFNPPKQYKIWYQAPTHSVNVGGSDDPLGDDDSPPFDDEDMSF